MIKHPGGQANIIQNLSQNKGRLRGLFAGFQHHSAAYSQSRSYLCNYLQQRVTPWRDTGDNTDWFTTNFGINQLLFKLITAGIIRIEGQRLQRQVYLKTTGLGQRHAHFSGQCAG